MAIDLQKYKLPVTPNLVGSIDLEKYKLKSEPEGAKGIKGFGVGALKGVGSTLFGAGQLADIIIPGQLLPKEKPEILKAKGTAEKIGFGVEQIGEFFLPVGLAAKGVKVGEAAITASKIGRSAKIATELGKEATTLQKLDKIVAGVGKLGVRAGVGAVEAGGITAIQTGGDEKEIVRNALLGGAIPLGLTGVSKGIKAFAGPTSRRIETALIKPTAHDLKDGFKVQNVFKYDLGGSLSTTADKTHKLITGLASELKVIQKTTPQKVDLSYYLNKTKDLLTSNRAESFGSNTRISKAVDFLENEIRAISPKGIVDFGDAVQVKRGAGKLGACQYGAKDPDITALEQVANAFYSQLKVGLVKAAKGTKYEEINKK